MSKSVLDFSAARNPRSSAVSKFILMMSGPMHPTKARKHFWYLFRLLLGLVLFYLLITSHERSTVLLCAAGVVLLHGIVTFSLPRLWRRVGMPFSLSWLATVWIVYEGENHSRLSSHALTIPFPGFPAIQ